MNYSKPDEGDEMKTILNIIGFICIGTVGVWGLIYWLHNPTLTYMQIFLMLWKPYVIGMVLCFVALFLKES